MGYSDSWETNTCSKKFIQPFDKADYFTLIPQLLCAVFLALITIFTGEKDVSRAEYHGPTGKNCCKNSNCGKPLGHADACDRCGEEAHKRRLEEMRNKNEPWAPQH